MRGCRPSRGRRSGPGSPGWTDRWKGGQALLGVAAVFFEMPRDQGIDRRTVVGVEIAAGDEVVGQAGRLSQRPGLEASDELDLVDQAVLEGEDTEKQVM